VVKKIWDKGGSAKQSTGEQVGLQQYRMQQQMQQDMLDKQERDDQIRREDDARRRSTNMMIGFGVGGVLIVGLVIFLVVKK